MSVKKIEVEVSQSTYEVLQVVVKTIGELKKAAQDGVQFHEVVALGTAFVADLLPHIQKLEKLDDEAAESPVAFGKAVSVCVADIAKSLGAK